MKKKISTLFATLLVAALLAGCGTAPQPAEPTNINVGALKGPTAMGMVKLMEDDETSATAPNDYTFTLVAAPDEMSAKLAKGELDIAAVPANLAAVLYQNTDKQIRVLAVNTLGVLYIVENGDSVKSVADLKGKTIYAAGKGTTPEFGLRYILEQNNINPDTDVKMEWKTEHAECVAALAQDENSIALLPQPFVTTAQMQNENLHIALDLTKEWDALQQGKEIPSGMITGVVVARNDFIEQSPEAVDLFLEQYQNSVEYVNGNTEDAAQLIEKFDILKAAVAQKALPYCNIVCITGDEMQQKLSGYLTVLYEQNPKSVGDAMPEEDFYYHGK